MISCAVGHRAWIPGQRVGGSVGHLAKPDRDLGEDMSPAHMHLL